MIRMALLNEINSMISKTSQFKENDFLITTTKKTDTYVPQIEYRFDPQYQFSARIPNQKTMKGDDYEADFKIIAHVSPGEIGETETVSYRGKSALFDGMHEWLFRVHDELSAIPLYRQVTEQKEQIENLINQFEEIEDSYFSQKEAEALKQKLDELEKKLTDNLKSAIQDKKELSEKLKAVENDINTLKINLASHKKRGWAGTLAVRIFDWVKDPTNRKVITSGAQVAKELLLEAGKHLNDNK